MTNETRNIQFCKNTLEELGSFLLQFAFFLSVVGWGYGKHPSVTGVIPVCWCLEGSLKERNSWLASRVVITLLDCDLCRVLSAQSAGGGNYKIGKCNGERDNGTSPRWEEKPCKLNFKMTMRPGDWTFYGQ